jgi:hypothetical protein
MMVCQVQLNGTEELLIGIARESRPALTLSDPMFALSDGAHRSRPRPSLNQLRPVECVFGWPHSTGGRMRATRWRYVSKSFPPFGDDFALGRIAPTSRRERRVSGKHNPEHPSPAMRATVR